MKLKEKLAKEFQFQVIYGQATDPIEDYQLVTAYLAGFEKAREMAIAYNKLFGGLILDARLCGLGEEEVKE